MAAPSTIEILSRQAARWTTASQQDDSPFIANLHANYGVAYALALRDLAEDDEIEQVTGLSGRDLLKEATSAQDKAAMALASHAPHLVPQGPLVALAKEGLPTSYPSGTTQVHTAACAEVAKAQNIRLLDVFVLGPATVVAALHRGPLPALPRLALIIYGVATSVYNWRNFKATRELRR